MEIRNLPYELRSSGIPEQGISQIESLVRGSLLDPDVKIRKNNLGVLNKQMEGFDLVLQSGFAADNQLFLGLSKGQVRNTFYVCDMPAHYAGRSPPKAYRFDRKKKIKKSTAYEK